MKINKKIKQTIECPACGKKIYLELNLHGDLDIGIGWHWVPVKKKK